MPATRNRQPTSATDSVAALRQVRPAMSRYGVERVWLFGSRARQQAVESSDWDLLVDFSRPPGLEDFMNLKFMLEEELGGRVDLVSRAACKPRFLAAIKDEILDVA